MKAAAVAEGVGAQQLERGLGVSVLDRGDDKRPERRRLCGNAGGGEERGSPAEDALREEGEQGEEFLGRCGGDKVAEYVIRDGVGLRCG